MENRRPIELPDDDEFPDLRITLKKDSGKLFSSIHKAGNSRSATTDLVSMQNRLGDDEWLPEETKLTNTRTLIQNSNPGHKKKTKKASLPKKKTAKDNSRSRLMKKLNF